MIGIAHTNILSPGQHGSDFQVFAELADAESRRVVNELAAAVLKDEKPAS